MPVTFKEKKRGKNDSNNRFMAIMIIHRVPKNVHLLFFKNNSVKN